MNLKRFIPILFIPVAVAGCRALAPSPADTLKEEPVVTVENDGENLVLVPKEAGKAYVVLGYLRDGKGESQEGSSGLLPYFVGEQKIPAKDYSKLVVGEIHWVTEAEVHLPSGQSSDFVAKVQPCVCDLPMPPVPPYRILGALGRARL